MAKSLQRRGMRIKVRRNENIGQVERLEDRRLLSSVSAVVFEEPGRAAIRGNVFSDSDGNGFRGINEAGLGGRTVYLDASGDGNHQEGEITATTRSDGRYAFEGLAAGTYHVREIVPGGWNQTLPQSGVYDVTLAAGQNVGDRNFGDLRIETPAPLTGTIRGAVFSDLSGDGFRQDGEPGLSRWLVYLDTSGDGNRQDGEPTRTTGADGKYAFEGLAPGPYVVREVLQAGWTQTGPVGGAYGVTVTGGQTITDRNFGDKRNEPPPPATGTIRGVVFSDIDSDGTRDDGEAGLAGWLVYIDTSGDGKRQDGEPTRVTNGDGRYAFEGIAPGNYSVREVVQPGFTQTGPFGGAYAVTVFAGQTIADRNFGDHRNETPAPGTIRGVVFSDIDSDGTRDDGEAGLSGWLVYLDTSGDGNRQEGEPTRRTGADGRYAFEGLAAGDYSVREVPQTGFSQTAPIGGVYAVTLAAGQAANDRNFGNHRNEPSPSETGVISGRVFNDVSGDGLRQDGEGGIFRWQIYIDGNTNGKYDDGERSTFTNFTGGWRFSGLIPGQYVVRARAVSGWQQTAPGPDGGFTVTIAAGQVTEGLLFGEHRNVVTLVRSRL